MRDVITKRLSILGSAVQGIWGGDCVFASCAKYRQGDYFTSKLFVTRRGGAKENVRVLALAMTRTSKYAIFNEGLG